MRETLYIILWYTIKINNNDDNKQTNINKPKKVLSIIKLLHQSEVLYNSEIIGESVNLEDNKIHEAIKCIASFKDESFEFDAEFDWNEMEKLGNGIDLIWNLSAIQLTYSQRGRFAIPDNIDYFFKKVTSIFIEDYYPSHQDVLRTRIRTTGMIETKYEINKVFFNIYDVGGQRNERRKWIHSFADVTAVLFVSALNHYHCVLFEDEKKNAMHESIALFDEIINSKWFKKTEIILFLNKKDLFAEAIRDEIPLSICFNIKNGWNGIQWNDNDNPNDYKQNLNDENEDNQLFEKCYKANLDFITEIYLSYNQNKGKRIFVHVTDATDRDQIERVFWDVQDIVIRSNLKRGGFV